MNIIELIDTFFEDNPIGAIISLITFGIALIAFIYNTRKYYMDKSTYSNGKSSFSLYIEKFFRLVLDSNNRKRVLFKITITNKSTTSETFTPFLQIAYHKDEQPQSITIPYEIKYAENLNSKHFFIDETIRLEGKDSVKGWLIFKFPSFLTEDKIDYYDLIINNSDDSKETEKIYLMKDIYDENEIL